MPKKNFSVVLLAVFLLPLLSCATNVSGTNQKMGMATTPTAAEVTIDGRSQKTPAMFVLDRNRPFYLVSIKQEGYQSSEIYLRRNVNGWTFGNIIFGGALGFAVDITTGAIHKFQPTHYEMDLAAQVLGISDLEGKDIIFVKVNESKDG